MTMRMMKSRNCVSVNEMMTRKVKRQHTVLPPMRLTSAYDDDKKLLPLGLWIA